MVECALQIGLKSGVSNESRKGYNSIARREREVHGQTHNLSLSVTILHSVIINRHRWRKASQPLASGRPKLLLLIPLMCSLRQLLDFAEIERRLREEVVDASGQIGADIVLLRQVLLLDVC